MTDPTNLIDSRHRADMLAHAMLRLAPDPSPALWQATSEPILGALLYAASPNQTGAGMNWVHATVAALASTDRDTVATTAISDPNAASILRRLDGLAEPQRASIIATLRGAVTPWLAVTPRVAHDDARPAARSLTLNLGA